MQFVAERPGYYDPPCFSSVTVVFILEPNSGSTHLSKVPPGTPGVYRIAITNCARRGRCEPSSRFLRRPLPACRLLHRRCSPLHCPPAFHGFGKPLPAFRSEACYSTGRSLLWACVGHAFGRLLRGPSFPQRRGQAFSSFRRHTTLACW